MKGLLGSLPTLAGMAADRDAAALALALARRSAILDDLAGLDRLLREPAVEKPARGSGSSADTTVAPLAGAAAQRWQDWTAQRRRVLDAALAVAETAVAEARDKLRTSDGRRRAVDRLGQRLADEGRTLRRRRLESEGLPPD